MGLGRAVSDHTHVSATCSRLYLTSLCDRKSEKRLLLEVWTCWNLSNKHILPSK